MLNRVAAALRAALDLVRSPQFWWLAAILVASAVALAALIAYAVERHDSFLRLRPVLCAQDISDRKFFLVAVAAPPWLVFVLTTLGELWQQLELRRARRPTRWFYFWLYLALAVGLGAVVLFGLSC